MANAAATLPKIYGFINGGEPGWYIAEAISEDGVFLAQHACSSKGYGCHDLGCDGASTWKHENYAAYYPNGFVVVWVEDPNDQRVQDAYAKHVACTKEEYAAKFAPVVAMFEAKEAASKLEHS